ncbi:hypothetical protein [Sphingobacterium zeae]|uniref:hypothetical protein n=1 Tax=Sphingobacterium zeae TaxID=1776859 RepID=UPI003613D995
MQKSNLVTLLFSLFSGARINIIGQLFGSEAVALIFFPFRSIKSIFSIKPVKKILLPYGLFLCSLVVSDIFVNDISSEQFLRGWSNIIFSFIQVIFLINLFVKSEKNYSWYLMFAAISFFIFRPQMEGEFMLESNAFKVFFMFGVNSLILLLAYHLGQKSRSSPILIFFAYALFCMIADARSNGVVYFLSAIIYCIKIFRIKLSYDKIAFFFSFVLFIGYSGYIYYASKVLSGEIGGGNARQILELENPYNPFELLAKGRVESLFALTPIMDRPFFGFGSWANDATGQYILEYNSLKESPGGSTENRLIPAHSIVLASWLWAGLGGLVGVVLLYFRVFKWGFTLFMKTNSNLLILIIPLMLDQMWNFLFSPIGHLRQTAPFFFALVIVEYYRFCKQKKLTGEI